MSTSKTRCDRCNFARYCDGLCQQLHWQAHKHVCSNMTTAVFDRTVLKNGFKAFYGPVSAYEFELMRHNGMTDTTLTCVGYADLSVPHKLVNR